MTNEKPKPFPLEKILTISAGDYLDIAQSETDYDMVGVHVTAFSSNIAEGLSGVVPENTEVVVGYRFAIDGGDRSHNPYAIASGTALIPKKK